MKIFKSIEGVGKKNWLIMAAVSGPLLILFALMPTMFLPKPEAPANLASKDKAIVIDLEKQVLYAYENGKLVHRFLAVSGMLDHETPPGNYKVRTKKENHHSSEFDAPMPYTMFIIEERGIAIHAGLAVGAKWRAKTMAPAFTKHIGSHGCVGLELWDAKTLFEWAPMFTPVEVKASFDGTIAQN